MNQQKNIWTCLDEQFIPNTFEKEAFLKNSLFSLTKGFLYIEEYMGKFKLICDNLGAIKKSMSDTEKVFHLA